MTFKKIKGPFADFLNNNKDFQIINNDKKVNNDNEEFLSHNNDITDFNSNDNNGLSKDSDKKVEKPHQFCCCCSINKNDGSSNKITIKQFIQRYTNSSNNKFYGQ